MIVDATPLPGYQEPYGQLCAILQDGTNEWRLELDPGLSEDAVVWQAHPGMHSIGGVILHIIGVEIFWFERFVLGLETDPAERQLLMADEISVDAWRWAAAPRKPRSWYFERHDRVRARTLESIKLWPSPETTKTLDGHPRTMRWILGHVIQHEAYHGGQAVLLNRLWQLRGL